MITYKCGGLVLAVALLCGNPLQGGMISSASLRHTALAAQAYSAQALITADRKWLPPLGEPLRITRYFVPPPTPYAAGHRGIDLAAVAGAQVYAPVAGKISFVGQVVDRAVLTIKVDATTLVSFEPLIADETILAAGEITVLKGQKLGTVADGGHCSKSCLHVGVRRFGEYVNPLQFFFTKPRLLPW